MRRRTVFWTIAAAVVVTAVIPVVGLMRVGPHDYSKIDCSDPKWRKMILNDINESGELRAVDVYDGVTLSADPDDAICLVTLSLNNGEQVRYKIEFTENSLGQTVMQMYHHP